MADAQLRRSIGQILLSHGYVTAEQIEEAAARQERTGKPLGQLLVEAGAISRLELASALAEQWADAGSIAPLTADEAREAQTAVTRMDVEQLRRDLEQRVRGLDRDEHLRAAPVDEEVVARLSELEEAVAELRQQDATAIFTELRAAVLELERRAGQPELLLEELERRLDDTVTNGALAARLAELGSRLDAVSEQGSEAESRATAASARVEGLGVELANALAGVRQQIDDLAHPAQLEDRVEGLAELVDEVSARLTLRAETTAVDQLAERLGEIAARIERVEQDGGVDALRQEIVELASRPASDPELAGRVDELAARVEVLAAGLGEGADTQALDELASRLDELSALATSTGASSADASLDEIRSQIEELAARPTRDIELEGRLEGLVERLEELGARVGTRAEIAAVDQLASRLGELAARVERVPAPPDLAPLERRVDALAAAVAEASDGEEELQALRSQVEELIARPVPDPELEGRVEALGESIAELTVARREPTDATGSEPDPRVDGLVSQVEELASRVERASEIAAQTPVAADGTGVESFRAELDARIAEVGGFAERLLHEVQLAAEDWESERAQLRARVEQLATRIESAPAPAGEAGEARQAPVPVAGGDPEVERLLMTVERLSMCLTDHERALTTLASSNNGSAKVDELAARLALLEAGSGMPAGGVSAPALAGADVGGMRAELMALTRRVEAAEELAQSGRDSVLQQLERMASSLEWRLHRLESPSSD